MSNLINIIATFADKEHYLNKDPQSIRFAYESDGKPLNAKDAAKIETVTEYFLEHELYPIFIAAEAQTYDQTPFEAESLLDLNIWTNSGLPKYKIRDNYGKVIEGLPNAIGGRIAH